MSENCELNLTKSDTCYILYARWILTNTVQILQDRISSRYFIVTTQHDALLNKYRFSSLISVEYFMNDYSIVEITT